MKLKVLLIVCLSCLGISLPAQYYATSSSLNMDGALKLAQEAVSEARKMDKNVSVGFFSVLPFLHPDSFRQNIPDPEPRICRCRIILEYNAEHVLKILLSIS